MRINFLLCFWEHWVGCPELSWWWPFLWVSEFDLQMNTNAKLSHFFLGDKWIALEETGSSSCRETFILGDKITAKNSATFTVKKTQGDKVRIRYKTFVINLIIDIRLCNWQVELHCRLEGCVRPKTLWDMASHKSMPMPRETEEEFLEFCGVSKERRNPEELNQWLKKQALTVSRWLARFCVHVCKNIAVLSH